MNIYLPNNIFSKLIFESLSADKHFNKHFLPSSVLVKELSKDNSAVAIVPLFDLLKNKDLFVSSKFGMSFDGNLSVSYFYFKNNADINRLNIAGDVSSTEVLLSKIIFREEYGIDIDVEISFENKKENRNLLVVGDTNFIDKNLNLGLSLSEKLSDLTERQYPFVNYILVSQNKNNLKYFDGKGEEIQNYIYDTIDGLNNIDQFSDVSIKYIKENISSLIINLEEQDQEGLTEELKLPYYHGFVKDIVDVKFV